MVVNVRYSNGQPSHITLPFEYRTPILSSIQMVTVLIMLASTKCVSSYLPDEGECVAKAKREGAHYYHPICFYLSAFLFGKQGWVKTEFKTKVLVLIHNITVNRIRHASGPVHHQHPCITYMITLETRRFLVMGEVSFCKRTIYHKNVTPCLNSLVIRLGSSNPKHLIPTGVSTGFKG